MQEKTDNLQQLKNDLKNDTFHNAYLFYGEETYLRDSYLTQLKEKIVPTGFEDFNYHVLQGKNLQMYQLQETIEALPMMAEKTLTVVVDYEIHKLLETDRELLISTLNDLPSYSVVVFSYDLVEYKRDGKMKKLNAALDQFVLEVNFEIQDQQKLISWMKRRFAALDKTISDEAAEHLLFTCGSHMQNLVGEISKIGAFAKQKDISIDDITQVATPVLDAQVFDMTNAVTAGDYDKAAKVLSDLLRMQEEPIMILGAIGKELRKIYTARIAIEDNKSVDWLMSLWSYKSSYGPNLWMNAARRVSHEWCSRNIKKCQILDRKMKSEKNFDNEQQLKLFLMELAEKT